MKKSILAFIVLPYFISAQIGINTITPTKSLDNNGELRVRTLPQGATNDDILSADTNGNVRKISRNDLSTASSGFNNTILGYDPKPVATRPQPPGAVPGGGTATELGCKKWSVNNHTYCAYQLSQGINWFNAFSFGKQMGGYLVTMPSDAERIWVATNIVASGTGYNLGNNIWIGFNKIQRPGNPDRLQWISGEEFRMNWSTNPATTENWFATGEPNNAGGTEGSTHIYNTSGNTERRWNDLSGSTTTFTGSAMNQLIIEFNE
ncbi:C-type lectin domain-containing protein [Chryseobacterium arthrosphaerae]|uniref:C-type lectin domain-containing protein n=1 Tax=Chryseobacterium arthrosphaerae TaxID=651561 RepID=UPI0023E1F1DC|nr:C-type lectin domain-containing protein [Chryseobacterium arthrosphaerae]WES97495.1 C-type lectin domain-containing protein [Chryseobacterium arthrosphaerae]